MLSCKHRYRYISYQDEAPVLVTNAASLESLNTQLKSAIEMRRFRPNLVISGADAWMEDRWEHLAFCRPGTDPYANPGIYVDAVLLTTQFYLAKT